ncbi:MAG: type II secretion system GspH family protein [Actinomycetota bacterium]|nr:type II secretion system GspH family protein [Actinomycetota bacterium]
MTGHRLRGEDGTTLVELLTVMAVSAVVLAFVTGTVVDAMRSQRRQTVQVLALNDAKLAFERVTRDIRAADPLRAVAPDSITLDVRRADAAARTVTYERAGDSLAATEAASASSRSLVDDLAPGLPLFVFHLFDGSTATGGTSLDPGLVESVTVRLRVEPAGAGRVLDLANRVAIRNART